MKGMETNNKKRHKRNNGEQWKKEWKKTSSLHVCVRNVCVPSVWCVRVCMYAFVCLYVCVCMRVCVLCVSVYVYMCVYVPAHLHVRVRVCLCIQACMFLFLRCFDYCLIPLCSLVTNTSFFVCLSTATCFASPSLLTVELSPKLNR